MKRDLYHGPKTPRLCGPIGKAKTKIANQRNSLTGSPARSCPGKPASKKLNGGYRKLRPKHRPTNQRNKRSECFNVGDDVFDLGGLERLLHGGHQGVAVLDPRCQGFRSDFVAVHGESFALGNTFESRSDLLRVAVREMAHG